jgi:glutamate 5-kinase
MPDRAVRQEVIPHVKRIVVKLGTQLITCADGSIDLDFLSAIADQIQSLRVRGIEVTLVSSGAIGAGLAQMGYTARPTDIAELQAAAAVGQRGLMMAMHAAFIRHGVEVGQLLLTQSDIDDRQRFLNIRNCIARLHAANCMPVINENDSVAVDEIRFGDNDVLASLVTNVLRADLLVLLSVIDGVMDADGQVVDGFVSPSDAMKLDRQEKSARGTGGLQSKVEAARRVTEAGEIAIIANGRTPDILPRLLAGERLGSLFLPAQRKLDSRQRWIGLSARPAGKIIVDAGAERALIEKGSSLLAIGVTQCAGGFVAGDVVAIVGPGGTEVGRGLVNLSCDELSRVKGLHSDRFGEVLGPVSYHEVIHRDHLVLRQSGA